ncbi:hypothetical protein D3C72_1666360 [compost metagenome]
MPTVAVPSRNSDAVSLMPRPQRRWMRMNSAVPNGRPMNAKEKIVKLYSSPASSLANGK